MLVFGVLIRRVNQPYSEFAKWQILADLRKVYTSSDTPGCRRLIETSPYKDRSQTQDQVRVPFAPTDTRHLLPSSSRICHVPSYVGGIGVLPMRGPPDGRAVCLLSNLFYFAFQGLCSRGWFYCRSVQHWAQRTSTFPFKSTPPTPRRPLFLDRDGYVHFDDNGPCFARTRTSATSDCHPSD